MKKKLSAERRRNREIERVFIKSVYGYDLIKRWRYLSSVSSNHQYSRSTSSRARFENLRQQVKNALLKIAFDRLKYL